MRKWIRSGRWMVLALALAVVACSQSEQAQKVAADSAGGSDAAMHALEHGGDAASAQDQAALQSTLAYEHSATVHVDEAQIAQRMQDVRSACEQARFGQCVVLTVEQQGGDAPGGRLEMRMVPKAIEPTLALAADGGALGNRSTRAEDLAVVIRDNQRLQQRLQREREQLQGFQQRPGLAVADMIALSRQLAEVEAQLEDAEQQAAQHQRRVRTQLLSIQFQPGGGQSGRNQVLQALRDSGAVLALGLAWTIRSLAFLAPLLLLIGAVLWWRRRRRR